MSRRVVIAAVGLAATMVGLGRVASERDALAEQFPQGLRLGYAVEAPYAFVDERGRVTGAIPDLARYVAERLGVGVTFVQTDFGALLDQLDEGRFDVVAADMFVTPERAGRVRFSVPTFQAAGAALVRRGNPLRLHSLDDVREAGASVVVQAATVEEAAARHAGIASDRIIVVLDTAAARRALDAGRADLLLNSEPAIRWALTLDATHAFEQADPFDVERGAATRPSVGAFAFRTGDAALAEAWNRVLTAFLGTPEHLALIEPFGFTRGALPPAPDASSTRTTP